MRKEVIPKELIEMLCLSLTAAPYLESLYVTLDEV